MATLRLAINGKSYSVDTDPQTSLLTVLRENLELTGSKYGCGEGMCGACTVLIDGKAQRSCITRVGSVSDKQITTIEGLATGEELHPVQQAFLDAGAMQCGYCTSGNDYVSRRPSEEKSVAEREPDYRLHGRQRLPLWNLFANRERDPEGGDYARIRDGERGEPMSAKQTSSDPMTADTTIAERVTAETNFEIPLEPERYELRAGAPYRFDLDRRDFFKFLGAGIVVVSILKPAMVAQESGSGRRRGESLPKEIDAWLHHWRKRQGHGLHGKG